MKIVKIINSIIYFLALAIFAIINSCSTDDEGSSVEQEQQSEACTFEQIDENMDGLIDDEEKKFYGHMSRF